MLIKNMIIEKFFNKKVQKEYFFIKGKIDLDSDYFINKIKSCWGTENQLNKITNIKGLMTTWDYFVKDPKFLEIMSKLLYYIDSELNFGPYGLNEAWGFEIKKNQHTAFHDHASKLWSGVIYLNSSQQNLIFPEINQIIKPEPGAFGVFSSFLKHGCHLNTEDDSKFAIAFNMVEITSW